MSFRRIEVNPRALRTVFAFACAAGLAGCGSAAPTVADAEAFVAEAEARLEALTTYQSHADWVASNFITHDTQILSARAQEEVTTAAVELASEAARYDDVELPEPVARKLQLLKLALAVPAPSDPALIAEVAELSAGLNAAYGSHRYCRADGDCLAEPDMVAIMATSRDPAELLDVWRGWRTMAPPMRDDYMRLMELANQGARELGFADLGSMWRTNYDLPPAEFAGEVERLMAETAPLYEALQCHVRAELNDFYGDAVVPLDQAIPAHLLGNMWAQGWTNVYDLVAPPEGDAAYDLTQRIVASGMDERAMVRSGEAFFTSMGFEPLPQTFWERSLFTKPRDRDVVCHASAWDFGAGDDYRIKMCIDRTAESFSTIHHELGHNFYQRAYAGQPILFRGGANPGFHEAIGDAVALSITPDYLRQVGLIERVPDPSGDLGLLMRVALDKVVTLPWTFLVDQWRWGLSDGSIPAERANVAWWELRERHQGVRAPSERGEEFFDPGAKFHVPAMVSYTRYFVANILQFQLHQAMCELAGDEGPLHRCSIYGSTEAGARLNAMLEMGASRPWPEALEALTGSGRMDGGAVLAYFAPLQAWLDEQNQGRTCGW